MIAILRYKHLLLGNPRLEIRSDNMSIKFLATIMNVTSPRLYRWSMAMSPILSKAVWTHVSGTNNIVADTISRQVYTTEPPTEEEAELLYDDMTFGTLCEHAEDQATDYPEHAIYQRLKEIKEHVDNCSLIKCLLLL